MTSAVAVHNKRAHRRLYLRLEVIILSTASITIAAQIAAIDRKKGKGEKIGGKCRAQGGMVGDG